MLKGINKIITPDLLYILAKMGHGDEIVISDGNFPGESIGRRTLRADGSDVPELLSAVRARYAPELSVLLKSPERAEKLSEAAAFTEGALCRDGKPCFYVCSNGVCTEGLSI